MTEPNSTRNQELVTQLRQSAKMIREWLHNDEGSTIIEILNGEPSSPSVDELLDAAAEALSHR